MTVLPIKNPWADEWLVYNDDGTSLTLTTEEYEKWKEDTIRSLGSKDAFDQEFGNVFLQTGESAVDEKLFEEMKAECSEPKFVFDEGHYLLWEEPNRDHIYVAGVDICEGVGEAASVIQIFDLTDLREIKQVQLKNL
jgi:hypothetical protein